MSVVIPTYNGSALVGRALASVLAQTRRPDEVVVVDDRSDDHTAAVAEAIGATSAVPIRVLRLTRNSGGPARPLNVGIASAQGDVIAVLEQDDAMRPRRIERLLQALEAVPESSVVVGRVAIDGRSPGDLTPIWPVPQFAGVVELDDDSRPVVPVEPAAAFRGLLRRNFAVSNSNLGFRKHVWRDIHGFNERIRTCTDLDYMLKAVRVGTVAVINEVVLDYHWRPDSLNRSKCDATMTELALVRLAAASAKPEWAGEDLDELAAAALSLITAALRRGDVAEACRVVIGVTGSRSTAPVLRHLGHRVRRRIAWEHQRAQ